MNMGEYINIDVRDFVASGVEKGELLPVTAVKHPRFFVKHESNRVVEVNENGEVIIDELGRKNEWAVSEDVFNRKCRAVADNPNLFTMVDKPQLFIQVPVNVKINTLFGEQCLDAGSWLNITNLDDVYGISERDFNDTYKIVEEQPKITL